MVGNLVKLHYFMKTIHLISKIIFSQISKFQVARITRKIVVFNNFRKFRFKTGRNGVKLSKITLFSENNTFEEMKSYFEEYQSFR